MYAGKLPFAQLMKFALQRTFRRLVSKYRGNFKLRCLPRREAGSLQLQTVRV